MSSVLNAPHSKNFGQRDFEVLIARVGKLESNFRELWGMATQDTGKTMPALPPTSMKVLENLREDLDKRTMEVLISQSNEQARIDLMIMMATITDTIEFLNDGNSLNEEEKNYLKTKILSVLLMISDQVSEIPHLA
jgi:hypothetical protein